MTILKRKQVENDNSEQETLEKWTVLKDIIWTKDSFEKEKSENDNYEKDTFRKG